MNLGVENLFDDSSSSSENEEDVVEDVVEGFRRFHPRRRFFKARKKIRFDYPPREFRERYFI